MSDWTNKYAIMRDLAEAQGFDVPADLEGIGANEKPPALNIPEDTGEDYFGHREGDGDCGGPPDLALIQHMLNMVRDVNIANCEDASDQVVQITKPSNPNIGVDITNTNTGTIPKTITENVKGKKVKKKRGNCALNSILQAMSDDTLILNMERPKELKLLKPTDFILDSTETEMTQSVKKVNGWLDTQVPSTSVSKLSGNPLILEPGSMFKRKSGSTVKSVGSDSKSSSPQKQADSTTVSYKPTILAGKTIESSSSRTRTPLALEPRSMFKTKSSSTVKSPESLSVQSPPPQQQVTSMIASYKPSTLAGEYYQKYVERNKMKELVQENIWSKAERIMKEIDARTVKEAEAAAINAAIIESKTDETAIDTAAKDEATVDTSAVDPATETKIPDTIEFLQSSESTDAPFSARHCVELPQHRHLLTDDCIVCKVVKAHGYDVDAEIYGNVK